MALDATSPMPQGRARIFSWPRVRFTLGVATLFGVLLSIGNETQTTIMTARKSLVGVAALIAFGMFEQTPT